MGFLSLLPDALIASIISNYLSLTDIVNLDNAILNHQERISLLSSYQQIQFLQDCDEKNPMRINYALWFSNKFHNLLQLSICDDDIFDDDIYALFPSHRPHQIKKLTILRGQYTNNGLSFIFNQCTNLSHLGILNNAFITALAPSSDFTTTSSPLTHLSKLKVLDLSGCSGAKDDLLLMISTYCTNLVSLYLRNCWSLTNTGLLSIICHCHTLKQLDLNQCSQINDSSISQIPQHLPHLRMLDLTNCVDLTSLSLLPITSSLVELEILNITCLEDTSSILFYQQIALHLVALLELRICSLVGAPHLFEIIKVLSTGCLRLKYLSLASSSMSDEILTVFNDLAVFPSLQCLDFTEDDNSIYFPLPYYNITPQVVQQICQRRNNSLFIRINPVRYLCQRQLGIMDLEPSEDDYDDDEDDDDVYGNILTYSQLPEYYAFADTAVNHYIEDDEDFGIDEWDRY